VEILESVAQNFQIHQVLVVWVVHPGDSKVGSTKNKILIKIEEAMVVDLRTVDMVSRDLRNLLDIKGISSISKVEMEEFSHITTYARIIMPMMISISIKLFRFKSMTRRLEDLYQDRVDLILRKISTSMSQLRVFQVCDRGLRFNARCSFHRMGSLTTLVSLLGLKVQTKNNLKSKHTARFSSGI